jgi:hypothetical protein
MTIEILSVLIEVLMPLSTVKKLEEGGMWEVGLMSISGPTVNGAIYRRYGVFKYQVLMKEETYWKLTAQEFPLGKEIGDMFTENERLGFQLMLLAKNPPVLMGSIQMFGYKQERQKANTERKALLKKIYAELRTQQRPHSVAAPREALNFTLH